MPADFIIYVICIKGVVPGDDSASTLVLSASRTALIVGSSRIVERVILEEQEISGAVRFDLRPGVIAEIPNAEVARIRFLDQLEVVPCTAIDRIMVNYSKHITNSVDPVGDTNFRVPCPVGERNVVHPEARTSTGGAGAQYRGCYTGAGAGGYNHAGETRRGIPIRRSRAKGNDAARDGYRRLIA